MMKLMEVTYLDKNGKKCIVSLNKTENEAFEYIRAQGGTPIKAEQVNFDLNRTGYGKIYNSWDAPYNWGSGHIM